MLIEKEISNIYNEIVSEKDYKKTIIVSKYNGVSEKWDESFSFKAREDAENFILQLLDSEATFTFKVVKIKY